jgi:hypothetical protein
MTLGSKCIRRRDAVCSQAEVEMMRALTQPRSTWKRVLAGALGAFACVACGDDPKAPSDPEPEERPPADGLEVEVSADRRTFVDLDVPEVIAVDDPEASLEWDLAFRGFEIATNGGVSGPGAGSAFGPLPEYYFFFPDEPIDAPFLIEDKAGGAFLGWYVYDGDDHTIYTRYHVYGVRSGEQLFKVQILSYYGEVMGAPVSALYQVRYAEVSADGVGTTREITNIDATVDGDVGDPTLPSAVLSLASGEVRRISPEEAQQDTAWDLGFRRDSITVNGELSGPGGVTAVDLNRGGGETLEAVKALTASDGSSRFDAVDHAALSEEGLDYRGDGVTSAFSGKWADLEVDPPEPLSTSGFLVVGADGDSRYLVGFDAFDGANRETPGSVTLYVHRSPAP